METNTYEAELLRNHEQLVEQWRPFLDGTDESPLKEGVKPLKSDRDRAVMARMLENAKRTIVETDATTSVFGTNYLPQVLGMIRGLYPQLQMLDKVAVQPLDRPTGRVYYLDMLRGDSTKTGLGADPLADTRSLEQLGSQWVSYKDWASNTELGTITADFTMSITQRDVSVTSVKTKYSYTPELQQDLMAYHGLDANALLSNEATAEIARELDARIINTIRANIGAGTITYGTQVPTGYQFKEWKAEIFRAILMASANITRRRGQQPTWLICGTDALVELDAAGMIRSDGSLPVVDVNGGITQVGTLANGLPVTHVPYMPANEIILGRKGAGFADAGIMFLPYVLLFLGQPLFDPNVMKWTRSYMSRYGLFVASQYLFAKVVVDPTSSGIH